MHAQMRAKETRLLEPRVKMSNRLLSSEYQSFVTEIARVGFISSADFRSNDVLNAPHVNFLASSLHTFEIPKMLTIHDIIGA